MKYFIFAIIFAVLSCSDAGKTVPDKDEPDLFQETEEDVTGYPDVEEPDSISDEEVPDIVEEVPDIAEELPDGEKKPLECGENYTEENDECIPDTRIVDCDGLPEYAHWVSATEIEQVWDGEAWAPSNKGLFNTGSGCRFLCNVNYGWNPNVNACRARIQTHLCGTKPEGSVWNSVDRYSQTWGGEQWFPEETEPEYNEEPSEESCRFVCEINREWDGTGCPGVTRSFQCEDSIPENAEWNSDYIYDQTWDGVKWVPGDDVPNYNKEFLAESCRFSCVPGTDWDGKLCYEYPVHIRKYGMAGPFATTCFRLSDTHFKCRLNRSVMVEKIINFREDDPPVQIVSLVDIITFRTSSGRVTMWGQHRTSGGTAFYDNPDIYPVKKTVYEIGFSSVWPTSQGGFCGIREDNGETWCKGRHVRIGTHKYVWATDERELTDAPAGVINGYGEFLLTSGQCLFSYGFNNNGMAAAGTKSLTDTGDLQDSYLITKPNNEYVSMQWCPGASVGTQPVTGWDIVTNFCAKDNINRLFCWGGPTKTSVPYYNPPPIYNQTDEAKVFNRVHRVWYVPFEFPDNIVKLSAIPDRDVFVLDDKGVVWYFSKGDLTLIETSGFTIPVPVFGGYGRITDIGRNWVQDMEGRIWIIDIKSGKPVLRPENI